MTRPASLAQPSSNLNKCLFYALGLGPGPGKTGIVLGLGVAGLGHSPALALAPALTRVEHC